MTSKRKNDPAKNGLELYLTPEELEEYLLNIPGVEFKKSSVKQIAIEGNLINDEGKIGVYEFIAFMAMCVK